MYRAITTGNAVENGYQKGTLLYLLIFVVENADKFYSLTENMSTVATSQVTTMFYAGNTFCE